MTHTNKAEVIEISVIIPVLERHDDLAEVYQAHKAVLERLTRPYEFIFVVDGGNEETVKTLEAIGDGEEILRIIALPRDFGEATALTIGFERARGEILITLPAYFQVIPEGIEEVLKTLDQGYDLVVTRRFPRIDSWVNRVQTFGFHFFVDRLANVKLHDMSCGVRGIRKQVVQEVQIYGDLHRFFPILAFQKGFRIIELPVKQHVLDGRIRVYQPGVYLRRLLDILTLIFLVKFTKKPLRFFGLIGAGCFGGGFLLSLGLTIQRLLGLTDLADRPLLILGLLLMVLGVQIASVGLLGELIIFTHARKMRDYTVDKILE